MDEMNETKIRNKMHELESKIEYTFKDIGWLSKAMRSVKMPMEGDNYTNEALGTVGDTILKLVLADKFYREGVQTKGEITAKKSDLENNDTMYKLMHKERLINYAYNDFHFHDDNQIPNHMKVVDKGHDPYVEAIIGAVYYDSNYDTTNSWIHKWLLPLLEKYKMSH